MAEYFFELGKDDQYEVLQVASAASGRPAYLLEKDLWVVWTLRALYESPLAAVLTFKGGTSLSKAYRAINRFSEDIDLTYNIRHVIADLVGDRELPPSRAQADKWTKAVEERLPGWIESQVVPMIQACLDQDNLAVRLEIGGEKHDSMLLHYSALTKSPEYVKPTVTMEFGGRATGEPHAAMPVQCDMEGHVNGITFPATSPMVMGIARTFWEKATAAHVYCAQHRIRSERFARHWYDLCAISRTEHFNDIINDRAVADMVAQHKSWFFREKDVADGVVDYTAATRGKLRIVPDAEARQALAEDYAAMMDAGVLLLDTLSFDELMRLCQDIENRVNQATGP